MLEIIDKVEELIEESRQILRNEFEKNQNEMPSEYRLTLETVYLKLCAIQIEFKMGTNKFNILSESDLEKLMSLIINKENVYEF